MLDDDIHSKYINRQECIGWVGWRGARGGGVDQECLVFSFPVCVDSKKIPNASIKTDIRQGEEQCVVVNKGKHQRLGLFETGCTARLTVSAECVCVEKLLILELGADESWFKCCSGFLNAKQNFKI